MNDQQNPKKENEQVAVSNVWPNWWKRFYARLNTDRIIALATVILALGSIIATILTWQGFNDQRDYSARQINRMDMQLKEQHRFDTAQEHRMDSTAAAQNRFDTATLNRSGKQIAIAREGMVDGLRSYVELTKIVYNKTGDPDSLEIGNVGKTPAYNVAFGKRDTVARYPCSNLESAHVLSTASKATLSTDVRVETGLIIHGRPTLDEWKEIKDTTKAFYALIRVEYSDIFGTTRFTNVCVGVRLKNGRLDWFMPKCDNDSN